MRATNTTEIIKRKYYEDLYANKLDNLKKIDVFLETYKPPKLKEEEIENLLKRLPAYYCCKNIKNHNPASNFSGF